MRAFSPISAAFLLTFSACFSTAQNSDNCASRKIVVNVRDAHGKLVVGLPERSFHGEFRGKPVAVKSARVEIAPRRTLLLLDVSGSMSVTKQTWEMAALIADDLVAAGSRDDSLALMTFASDVRQVEDFTKRTAEVLGRLRGREDSGAIVSKHARMTAMWDALLKAVELFGEPRPGDAIYLISDGGDNHSRSHAGDVKRVLISKGIRVYSFFVMERRPVTEEEALGPTVLKDLGEATGGVVSFGDRTVTGAYDLSPKGRAELSANLQGIYDQMKNFYELEIELPVMDKPGRWKLDVVDEHGHKLNDVSVIYPHELALCTSAFTPR